MLYKSKSIGKSALPLEENLLIPGMSDKLERVFSGSRCRVLWDRTKTSAQLLEALECAKDWTVQRILGILL
jgi:hypothetical protein